MQAMLAMGYRHELGIGVKQSCQRAAHYLVCATTDTVHARLLLGLTMVVGASGSQMPLASAAASDAEASGTDGVMPVRRGAVPTCAVHASVTPLLPLLVCVCVCVVVVPAAGAVVGGVGRRSVRCGGG